MKNKIKLSVILVLSTFVFLPSFVQAMQTGTFGFQCVSNNLPGDCTIAETQLKLVISDWTSSSYDIRFTFKNEGPLASSITDIYFDDPTGDPGLGKGGELSVNMLDYSNVFISPKTSTVAFTSDANPSDLPSGGAFTSNYSADSDAPPSHKGVNPGESVTFKFNFTDTNDGFDELITAISNGSFSIGLHVQAFGTGGSESLVLSLTGDITPVPEPATMLLLGTGLAGIAGIMRKRKKTQI